MAKQQTWFIKTKISAKQVFYKSVNTFAFRNKISKSIKKIKTDLEDFNSNNRESYSDILFILENLTANFTFFVEEVADIAKECYNNISLTDNIFTDSNNIFEFKGIKFCKN